MERFIGGFSAMKPLHAKVKVLLFGLAAMMAAPALADEYYLITD
jgi:hypothetical protein